MFRNARINLTAWYLLIIMLISISFSAIIFQMLSSELDRFAHLHRIRIEQTLKAQYTSVPVKVAKTTDLPPQFDPEMIGETENRILITLGIINGIILIISGVLGYILAGKTLNPIKVMLDEQNRFIGDASHELRTPLTSLKLAMEVFLRDKHANLSEAQKLITNSIGEVDRLHYLSENLLALSILDHNSKVASLEEVSLSEIVKESVNKVLPQSSLKQINIKVERISQNIRANRQDMIDLLVILFDNAIKYSKNKSRIEVKFEKSSTHLDLHIIDQGIGIAKKDLPLIFDRFYRADSARVKGGHGLGLSIAQKIAKKNNVSLLVKSTLGEGSDFIIRFFS